MRVVNLIERTHCTICNNTLNKAEHLHTLYNMPISAGTVANKRYDDDILVDRVVCQCSRCGTIQLKKLVPLDLVYKQFEYHSAGTIGSTWQYHHRKFADFITKHKNESILEIGAGTTFLSSLIVANRYVIVDPNIIVTHINDNNSNTVIRCELFTETSELPENIDTVVMSHTMEHFYNVNNMIENISNQLPVGSKIIISIPIIDNMIRDGHINTLCFEHTFVTTRANILGVLQHNGFNVIDYVMFDEYNAFICAIKKPKITPQLTVEWDKADVTLWNEYVSNIDEQIYNINVQLQKHDVVFLFGAHVSSQILLSAGLDDNKIVCILDNDPKKQNKRLYGTKLMILSPKILTQYAEVAVIVKMNRYTDEIVENLKQINKSVVIL